MTAAGLLSVRQLRVEYRIRTGGFLRARDEALRAVDGVRSNWAAANRWVWWESRVAARRPWRAPYSC